MTILTAEPHWIWKVFAIAGPLMCLIGNLWLGWGFEFISYLVGLIL